MDQTELDALPDVTPRLDYAEREIDGGKILVPVVLDDPGALFQAPDDGEFRDMTGQYWITGYLNGRRVKRKSN